MISNGVAWVGAAEAAVQSDTKATIRPAALSHAARRWLLRIEIATITTTAVAVRASRGSIAMRSAPFKVHLRVIPGSVLAVRHMRCIRDYRQHRLWRGILLQLAHGRLKGLKKRLRVQANPEQDEHHRDHHHQFSFAKVRQRPLMSIGPMERSLDDLQRIERGDEDSDHRRHGHSKAYSVGAKQRQKFAHEIPHARQADG